MVNRERRRYAAQGYLCFAKLFEHQLSLKMMFFSTFVASALLCQLTLALDNGLARTPPMGWLSWERFRCNTDCKNDPEHCISEQLYKRQADLMVSEGYRDVGYEYVNIDDCWPAMERDKDGRLVADPVRFPSGIKALSRYMHSKGLKLGIYEDFGSKTCAGYPGSEFYMQIDANTFAEWEVDSLKFDGCNSDPKDMPVGYPAMSFFLNITGHPIMFSCEWPLYEIMHKLPVPNYAAIRSSCNQWRNYVDVQDNWDKVIQIIDHYGDDKGNFSAFAGPGGWNDPDMSDYRTIAKTCNIWRNYVDVTDSWDSIVDIINMYGKDEGNFSAAAGPGGFNDPDMLVVGDYGLSYYQQKAQFGMWALFAAPLMMSNDLSSISAEAKALLQNKNIIAINQDPLGNQAIRLFEVPGSLSVWVKKMASGGSAIGILNVNNQGTPQKYTTAFSDLGFTNKKGYVVKEAFENKTMGKYALDQAFTIYVDPTSIFIMIANPL
ncbi:hypothetical protein RRG08_010046 [Elysia crispata]|uniref:Alpha-galactosidase n=1 Tax=Elysia crispata TaxID=231223 RepID=A0AAE1ECZ7_9GAST|nr:hypothetical protein RRG08_010046 [Elysia crispata]